MNNERHWCRAVGGQRGVHEVSTTLLPLSFSHKPWKSETAWHNLSRIDLIGPKMFKMVFSSFSDQILHGLVLLGTGRVFNALFIGLLALTCQAQHRAAGWTGKT